MSSSTTLNLSFHSNHNCPVEKPVGYPPLILKIFKHRIPFNIDGEIVVSGYVLADGKGDYFHMRNIVKAIHKNFPKNQITLLVGSDIRHSSSLPLLDETICKTYFAFKGKGTPYLFAPQPSMRPEEFQGLDVLQKVKEAALIISGPIPLLGTFQLIEKEIRTKMIGFDEYNGDMEKTASMRFVLKAGVGKNCLGIFIKKKKLGSPKDLQNQRIKDILFNDPAVELLSNPLYLCYVTTHFAALKFIEHIIAYSEPNVPRIDICYPAKHDISLLAECFEKFSEYKDRWTAQGIGQMQIIFFKEEVKKEIMLKWSDATGILCIFDVGTLHPADFKTVVRLSGPFMGCTGDTSLAMALSNHKIPVYEVGGHKVDLLQNLAETAETLFGESSVLAAYFRTLMTDPRFIWLERAKLQEMLACAQKIESQSMDSTIRQIVCGNLLNGKTISETSEDLERLKEDPALSLIQKDSESLTHQAFELGEFLRSQKTIQPFLSACVAESLFRHKFPQFAQKEDVLLEDYLASALSEEQLLQALESELSSACQE